MSPEQSTPEKTGGLRSALSLPFVYSLLQGLIRGRRAYRVFVDDYVRPQTGDRVLDIGCGTAEILSYLPVVDYVGVDVSEAYVEAARKRYPDGTRFIAQNVQSTDVDLVGSASFDLVIAIGVIHHLPDDAAHDLFRLAATALKPSGRFVALDACYAAEQSPVARFLLSRDRGRHIRYSPAYVDLARQHFSEVEASLRHDLFRFPYTCLALSCSQE